jgi:hypothetical protein
MAAQRATKALEILRAARRRHERTMWREKPMRSVHCAHALGGTPAAIKFGVYALRVRGMGSDRARAEVRRILEKRAASICKEARLMPENCCLRRLARLSASPSTATTWLPII